MKNDSFIRVLLIVIVFLLALNIILPRVAHPLVSYAADPAEYKVEVVEIGKVSIKTSGLEKILNEFGKTGWEAISINLVDTMTGEKAIVVFKK